jgi:hypothetical protein
MSAPTEPDWGALTLTVACQNSGRPLGMTLHCAFPSANSEADTTKRTGSGSRRLVDVREDSGNLFWTGDQAGVL